MYFKVAFLCLALLTVAHSRHLDLKLSILGGRINGGEDAFPGQFPHQVSLQVEWQPFLNATHFCGGTILNERWILTAVHCLVSFEELPLPVFDLVVKAGKHDLQKEESTEQVSLVEKYFKHEKSYDVMGITVNDVALIKLKTPLKFNDRVRKAALPRKNSDITGQIAVSGWGSIVEDPEEPVMPDILQTITLPIIDRKTCEKAVEKVFEEEGEPLNVELVQETNICTGPLTGGVSPCVGDSGGPLMTTNDKGEWEVHGVASWTLQPCGRKGAPAAFARVSMFIDWIENTIRNN